MSVEENSPHLSTDLIVEIFSRLPSKSIARFSCLSKLWESLLTSASPYFTELFLTQSKTRPRLLFAVHGNDKKWYLYSSPMPQNSYKNSNSSSLTITAEFQMSFPEASYFQVSPPLSGLIYCQKMENSNGHEYPVVCNPSTGEILWLPKFRTSGMWCCSFFGYDPIHKQYSILCEEFSSNFRILNLRFGGLFWRSITCPLKHTPHEINTCINGVLYYIASLRPPSVDKIVCFNLNSEEFKFIDQPWSYDNEPIFLVNFKGKLCAITMMWMQFDKSDLAFRLWILEDFEKQEWSKCSYRLPSGLHNENNSHVSFVGVSVRGDIVLSLLLNNSYYIYFFNPEKNTLQEVEVKGFEEFMSNKVYGFVDYVEDLRIF